MAKRKKRVKHRKTKRTGQIWFFGLPVMSRTKTKKVKHRRKHAKKTHRHYYGKGRKHFQTGTSNKARDRKLKAKHPGTRKAKKSGRKYYEHRANRSDINIKKRL